MEPAEFDATLGGTEHLPYAANSLKFASSRSVEIAAMTESILRPNKTKLVFQTLPVHMRRRVMSHNCKRLPIKLRKAHLEQLKKNGNPPKQKVPSRKYRRRPANLLQEYMRRQKKNVWLETHIWHAKRFHMIERWGHRLPYAPCDKAFRACYRGSSAHCLLQDVSYLTPIQIIGTVEAIKEAFAKISSCSCGLSISAKAYINGTRQGTIHIYGINTYPFGYIGKVQFIWVSNDSNRKVLWLFVHPSHANQVDAILSRLIIGNEDENYETPKKVRKVDNNFVDIEYKVIPGGFNRFRLTGPNSHAILVQSLKCIETGSRSDKWMSLHNPPNLKEQEDYWKSITTVGSPSQLPPNMVLGLVVKDPRFMRPKYRTKAKTVDNTVNMESLRLIPPLVSNSPLWDVRIHQTIKDERMTNGEFNNHIAKTQLVPGEVNEDDPKLQSVPIILVQRPGSQESQFKKIGYGSGWDIIIPSGYALPFWLTFIMFGARSGGLRETESLAFEMGECYLAPDSDAGKDNAKRIEFELRDKYFRLPPSKRVNYIKLGICSPFKCPWNILLSDWDGKQNNDFFVLRDRNLQNDLQDCITKKRGLPKINNADSCLVPVYIKLVSKGSLRNHALICVPECKDIGNIKTLFEPQHEDHNKIIRKQNRIEHKKMLKKFKRKSAKLKKKNILTTKFEKPQKRIRNEPSEYVKRMRELWVPSKIETIRNTTSRQIMGYITQGAFSFTEACSCGVGYVAYNALNYLISSGMNQVLVRNTSSRKYQLANIVIGNK